MRPGRFDNVLSFMIEGRSFSLSAVACMGCARSNQQSRIHFLSQMELFKLADFLTEYEQKVAVHRFQIIPRSKSGRITRPQGLLARRNLVFFLMCIMEIPSAIFLKAQSIVAILFPVLQHVTNGAKVGLPQLGWRLSCERTHHPSPQ